MNIGLHFGIYETLNTNPYYRSAFERAMPRSWRTVDDDGRPRTSFAYSMVCGQCAGLVASTLVQPLDLVRRRQQLLGSGEGRVSFWRVASDLVRIGGVKELYRGLAPGSQRCASFRRRASTSTCTSSCARRCLGTGAAAVVCFAPFVF